MCWGTNYQAHGVRGQSGLRQQRVAVPLYARNTVHAPEVSQCRYTAAADIWSLGRVLCWLLSGHVPCGIDDGKLHCEQVMWG